MTAWTVFLKKFYNDKKKTNPNYKFKNAMVDGAKVYKKKSHGGVTDTPETPAPETPAPETLTPETPTPETPTPETPTPETSNISIGGKKKTRKNKSRKSRKSRKSKK